MTTPPSVQLHIEELVLHGFPPGDRHRIAEALQGELTRLLTDQAMRGSPVAPHATARLDGGSFQVAANSKPEMIGVQVARSVHKGMNP